MLFNNKSNFKKNFLVVYVSSYANKLYKDYEYEIYDELNQLHQEKGVVTKDDIQSAIRRLREMVCEKLLEYVGKEYKEFIPNAEDFLKTLYEKNSENINVEGPTVALVYSIATKMVLGEDYEFKMIQAGEDNPENPEDLELTEMIGVMIARLEKVEKMAIDTSLDLLKEDKIVK